MAVHNIDPIYDNDSRILILGSFPSVKSREIQFFYGHSQNRFWKIMEILYDTHLNSIEDKKDFLHKHHIALWDVIQSCEIRGSSDAFITNVVVNDISKIIEASHIESIYTNGGKAYQLYNKYIYKDTLMKAISLPSTSPANARYSLDDLIQSWKIIKL